MRALIKTVGVTATTAVLLSLALTPAHATDNEEIRAAVTGGGLTADVSGATLSSVALNNLSSQLASGKADTVWTITDARGSGAAWGLTASGTNFVSAAGDVDTTPRSLPIGNLVITPGVVTSAGGADTAPITSAVTMSNDPLVLVTAPGDRKGTFTLTPSFDLTVPANAFRSNFTTGVSGIVNPYVSTITFTIA